ncbi:DUF501 domain-containing protein [Actinomadura livida]|nr:MULTISPECIES: DUF501 domain-containing protein [Actinomadura]MBB4773209.1 hypothetical protein [Actinomadura catellatispora]
MKEAGDRAAVADADRAAVAAQLGREPRGVRAVASRCPCGLPAVIETAPRLPDGTPFPTLFYLTCPKAASAIGTLEGSGVMREMQDRLAGDPKLRAAYTAAHEDYLRRRDEAARDEGVEPLPAGMQSAGGMPERVKCLHALIAHELAVPGVNPFGREGLEALAEWWRSGPCVRPDTADTADTADTDDAAGTGGEGEAR